jgi:molybdopterin-biosynthesis enzyme MoeA-like protein
VDARSDLIVTSGGLGPTGDDLTLAAVAAAFNRPLVAHEEAMAMLTRRYSELAAIGWVKSAEMNEARRKMAMFPQGATPLYNPVGGAPAASLRVDGTTIVCLPGVPAELKGIFVQTMSPLLKELFGTATYAIRTVIVNCQDESQMAGELQGVVERHPRIYIKSRARRFGPDISIRVSLSTTGTDAASVASALDAAESDLAHSMARLGLTSTRAEE